MNRLAARRTMQGLRETYDRVARMLETPESFEVAQAVEDVRCFWRPHPVNVLLLAESHVFTSDEELRVSLRMPAVSLPGLPQQFVRFVYCLGYGEKELLAQPVSKNSGTPQFWKIFDSCCNDPSLDTSKKLFVSRTSFEKRLSAKLALLHTLRERGIWLLDASITGLYKPGGSRPNSKTVAMVLAACWDSYIRHVINAAAPKHIIVVGKGVARALESRLRESLDGRYTVLPQPQAHSSKAEIAATNHRYFSICRKLAPALN